MKKQFLLVSAIVLLFQSLFSGVAVAESDQKVTHVVMVWLTKPGDEQQRKQFIAASEKLNDLPGIVHRHVGVVMPSDRSIVDDTFDVAVTVTMKNKAALQAYLNHPKHKKILHKEIKPLVNRTVAYDFISE